MSDTAQNGLRHSGFLGLLQRIGLSGRALVISVPYAWLLLFFLVPFLIVLKIAVAESQVAIPPFTALIETVEELKYQITISFANFQAMVTDDLYILAYLNSLKIAAISTICCLLVGYPAFR